MIIYRSYRWQTKYHINKPKQRINNKIRKEMQKKREKETETKISYKEDILNEVLWVKFRYILLLKVLKKHTQKNHPHIIYISIFI